MIAKGKSPITYDHKTRVSRETGRCPLAHGAERALTRVARQNLPTCNYAHTDPSRDCDMLVPHQSMQLHWPCYNQSRRVMPYSLPSRHTSPPPRQRAPDVWDLGHAQTATPGAATNASTTCTRTPLQATSDQVCHRRATTRSRRKAAGSNGWPPSSSFTSTSRAPAPDIMIASCASRHTDDKSADATETIDNLVQQTWRETEGLVYRLGCCVSCGGLELLCWVFHIKNKTLPKGNPAVCHKAQSDGSIQGRRGRDPSPPIPSHSTLRSLESKF